MVETIAVLGANGVFARHLIPRLATAGYGVRALARRPEAATVAHACGATVVQADIFDTDTMVAALEGCTIGVNLATSLPGPSGRGTYEANDHLRSEGTANWIAACRSAGVARIVQQSIAMVNASGGPDWGDENTVFQSFDGGITANAIAASLKMEALVESSGLDWVILRGGLFYGPGTGFDDGWFGRAAVGKLRLPVDGSDFVSLVHIADMANATLATIKTWPSRQKLIVCDDQPATWRDVFTYITDAVGNGPPEPGGPQGFPSFRLSNNRFREATGWTPRYSSFREGLAR